MTPYCECKCEVRDRREQIPKPLTHLKGESIFKGVLERSVVKEAV